MANLIKTLAVGTTDYEFNAAQVSDTTRQHKLEVTTDGKVTIDSNQLALKSEITTAVEKSNQSWLDGLRYCRYRRI